MKIKIDSNWERVLKDELESEWFAKLADFVRSEYKAGKSIYPAPANIFRAFDETPFEKVRVVIIGQDPYHGPGQAQGLSFSVPGDVKNPPSLINIFKEIKSDLGHKAKAEVQNKGDLSTWAEQGVLLLNASLTVERSKPMSHSKIGWDKLTDAAIGKLSEQREGIVFMLWGSFARSKKELIDTSKHLVLEAPHPSPLSAHRGFFGCKHFSKCNGYIDENNIKW